MASICWSSASLLILLAFPFSAALISPLLGLVALPYFMAMASDLRYCGYKRHRRAAHLRLQPDPARGQPGRHVLVHRAGHHGVQGAVRAHAQGQGPHGRAAVPAAGALRADRAGRLHAVPRLRPPPHGELRLRGAQRHPGLLRGQGVHRPAQLLVDTWIHGTSLLYKNPRQAHLAGLDLPPPGGTAQADRLARTCCSRASPSPSTSRSARPADERAALPRRAQLEPRPGGPPSAGCHSSGCSSALVVVAGVGLRRLLRRRQDRSC